jgi:hypothetical protein
VTAGTLDVAVPVNPTPTTVDGPAVGTAVPSAVTVTTTVVTMTTVATPSTPVVVATGVTRGVEEVRPVVVPLDTMEEGEGLEAMLVVPVDVLELRVVAKPLVVTFDEGLMTGVLAMLVVGVPLPTVGDEVVPLVVGLPKPNVGAYDEPN